MSVWTCFTTCTGAAAGGGGGGGGGGGATSNVACNALGKASVNSNGISTRTPISPIGKRNAIVVVPPRFVLSFPPDSIRLSSNIRFSYPHPTQYLDTACSQNAPSLESPHYKLEPITSLLQSTSYSEDV